MLRKVATGILVVAFYVIACAYQPTFMAVPIPGSVIADANEALRLQVSPVMEQRALSLGLTLDTRDLLYICRDDFIMVSAGVAGFEDIGSSAGMLTVDVGLIYLSREVHVRFGDGKLGTRLPTGFYAVRATINQRSTIHDPGITILELFDSSGSSIMEFPVPALPASSRRRLTASLGAGDTEVEFTAPSSIGVQTEEGVACLGWRGLQFGCEMCVVFERYE